MGKSTILSEQECAWRAKPNSPEQRHLFVNLRSYQTESRLAAHLFESQIFKEWLNGTHTLNLFLDSLDEGLLSIQVLAACLVDEFKRLPSERLRLRIACRTAEWPTLLENGLSAWLGEEAVQHYVLAPLRKKDVETAASDSGLDAKLFLDSVESSAVVPFSIKPVTLNFLLSVYRKQGSLPNSQSSLYREGCRLLAAETSESRGAARYTGELTVEQRLAVAGRMAACMMLGNRNAVYTGTNLADAPSEDVGIGELSTGTELANDVRFNVGERAIRETLATGLFSTRGFNRIGWGHQTYAEFLAAWYLKNHDVVISQILSLITHPDDPNKKIIPQLGETAAWLAGTIPEIFQAVVQAEPDLLLKSVVASGDFARRAALVEALLQLYENEHAFDRDREHYKNLSHPDLADQLRPYVSDKAKGVIVRRVAIDIAESCNVQGLNQALLAVALDTSDNLATRVQAAYAIRRVGDDETRGNLKPLVFVDDADDIQDELKGSVLSALWPAHITVAELFTTLKPPKSEGFIGAYRFFLSTEPAKELTPQGLIPALDFLASQPPRHEIDLSIESLMDEVVMKAWEKMDVTGVTEALARFVASRLKHQDDLIKGRTERNDHLLFLQDENKRHLLLETVLHVTARDPECKAIWLIFTKPPLVLSEDFNWLISCLGQESSKEMQLAVIDLLERLFSRTPEHLEAIFEAQKRYTLVANRFNWVWEAVSRDSDEARKMKASYKEEQKWLTRQKKPLLKPTSTERVARRLEECESGPIGAWAYLIRELTLEPTSTGYDSPLEWDLMKLPGWVSADEGTKDKILIAAEQFIVRQGPVSKEPFETGQWTNTDISAYSALALLLKLKPAVVDRLAPDQIGRWCQLLLAFPFLDSDSDRAVKDALLRVAYERTPLAVLDATKVSIEREMEKGEDDPTTL
jgi:hypothetical protein